MGFINPNTTVCPGMGRPTWHGSTDYVNGPFNSPGASTLLEKSEIERRMERFGCFCMVYLKVHQLWWWDPCSFRTIMYLVPDRERGLWAVPQTPAQCQSRATGHGTRAASASETRVFDACTVAANQHELRKALDCMSCWVVLQSTCPLPQGLFQ